jgi:hypothetical protein
MGKRYAEGTNVPVESSRGEITGILAKHGVQRMGWQTGPDGDELLFELGDGHYKFQIRKPTLDEVKLMYKADGKDWSRVYDPQTKVAAEWKRRWRANVLLIKAKLEFASGGDTTVEREFLPYLLVGGRQTLAEWVETGDAQRLIGAGKNGG